MASNTTGAFANAPKVKLFPDLVDFAEPLIALGFDPRFLSEIHPDTEAMTQLLAKLTRQDPGTIRPVIIEFVSAIKEKRNVSNDAASAANAIFASALPIESAWLANDASLLKSIGNVTASFERLFSTSASESSLLRAIRMATIDQWLRSRAALKHVWSGKLEHILSASQPSVPPEFERLVTAVLKMTSYQRRLWHGTPWIRIVMLVSRLHSEIENP